MKDDFLASAISEQQGAPAQPTPVQPQKQAAPPKSKYKRSPFKFIALVIALCAVSFAFDNYRFFVDEFIIWQNAPSTEVIEFADKTTMNDYAKRIFYATTPSLEDANSFNDHCHFSESQLVILGCLTAGNFLNGQIYIFDIRDTRISDAKSVTAAHEMLHAAWQRLSEPEKKKLTALLEEAFNFVADDDLRVVMSDYARSEPGERVNELHSIMGTEYADLGAELEAYYGKYFQERARIVKMADSYKQVFRDLEKARTDLETKMKQLNDQLVAEQHDYEVKVSNYNIDVAAFNSVADYLTESEFYKRRNALEARRTALINQENKIEAEIEQYNAWVDEYNELGGRVNDLNKSFDSKFKENGGEVKA